MPLTRGDRLGKYEIVANLGSGGMGDVYRALDARLEREVAIKVIRSTATSAETHARIWREARAAASVSVAIARGDPYNPCLFRSTAREMADLRSTEKGSTT